MYDDWLFSGEKSYTAHGNRRAPSVSFLLQWIKSAWDKITPQIIIKSFLKCGLSNALNGTEDDLFAAEDEDDIDPFKGFDEDDVADADEFFENFITAAADNTPIQFPSFIRGYHVYKDIWNVSVGEVLNVIEEKNNTEDKFATAIIRNGSIVGHVPRENACVFRYYLKRGGNIKVLVTGN